ncbi:MAG: hypothetical protein WD048_04970 [Chitinophagales bacterium]
MKKLKTGIFVLLVLSLFLQCKKDNKNDDDENKDKTDPSKIENTLGFSLLSKIKGIWNGPVTSSTALGSYPEWIIDFRPVAENQISSMNELDTANNIHMSFFTAKYNGEYRLCFRNGGMFAGMTRVSYFLADSVSETSAQAYYRLSEIVKGSSRAYTEVVFRSDSLIIRSFTNKYNTLNKAELHMTWRAKLQDRTSSQPAVDHFGFPQKTLAKDFSNDFEDIQEAIFYSISGGDPYPESEQPYLGNTNITYSFASNYTPDPNNKVFLVITTEPLINGFTFAFNNMKFRSRYVVLSASDQDFTFTSMHPGTYYLYAIYDADGNNTFSSGDWVSSSNASFTLNEKSSVSASTEINFTIP